ncbi:MAG: hypothetical protein Q9173_004316 [Seirophora scorigena]
MLERLTPKRTVYASTILLGAILTLANLGIILHKSSRVYLFQQALCLDYHRHHNPTSISLRGHVEERLCKVPAIQAELSTIDGLDGFLQNLPRMYLPCFPQPSTPGSDEDLLMESVLVIALLILGLYKELLQQYGLRRLVILSLCCSALAVLYSISIFWLHPAWTAHTALLSSFFDLIGGGDIVRITIVSKCIADILPADELTNAYNYISGFYFLASVCGSAIGSLLLDDHVYILNSLSIACYLFTACLASTIPANYGRESRLEDDSQPLIHSRHQDISPRSLSPSPTRLLSPPSGTPPPELRRRKSKSLFPLLLESWSTSFSSILTLFAVPNPTFTVVLVFLLYGLAARIEILLPQYTSLALNLPLANVNRILALKALVSAVILFALPTIRKRYLEPRYVNKASGSSIAVDLFIIKVSLVANTVGIVGLVIPAGVFFFILWLCVYTSGVGLLDSLTSYGVYTLPPGADVAGFYVRTGFMNTIAALVGAPLWSWAFRLVVQNGWMSKTVEF